MIISHLCIHSLSSDLDYRFNQRLAHCSILVEMDPRSVCGAPGVWCGSFSKRLGLGARGNKLFWGSGLGVDDESFIKTRDSFSEV